MANSAFEHTPSFTIPSSITTANSAAIWSAVNNLGQSTIILDSGGNGRIGISGDTNIITLTSGTVTVAGTVAATTLTGAGAGITALAAGNITASGTLPALNGAALTALNGSQITTGTVADARISALTASKLTGALPAISGANLTGVSAFPYSSATVASIEATTSTHNDRIPSMYVTANDSGNMVDGFSPQIIFRATDSGATNSILGQMSFERSGADNSGKFRLQSKVAGADNTLMVIYPTGAMQLPDQPAFYAINASTDDNQTGNGPEFTLTFSDTETNCFDQGGNFSSNTFTAPVDGRYVFFAHMEIRGLSAAESLAQMRIKRNSGGTPYTQLDPKGAGYSSEMGMHLSSMMNLAANDTVTVTLVGTGESGNVWDINGQTATHTTAFSGFLVA